MPINSGNMSGYAWAFQSKTEKEKQALIELRGNPPVSLSITHNFCPHDGTQPDVREA